MLMIYGRFLFLVISVAFLSPLSLSDLSVHFVRSPFLSSHLTASSEPLLLLELWEARLDTPLSYELNSLIKS